VIGEQDARTAVPGVPLAQASKDDVLVVALVAASEDIVVVYPVAVRAVRMVPDDLAPISS
jgi:hypothetical protein